VDIPADGAFVARHGSSFLFRCHSGMEANCLPASWAS
jgi:hypothetical protein